MKRRNKFYWNAVWTKAYIDWLDVPEAERPRLTLLNKFADPKPKQEKLF